MKRPKSSTLHRPRPASPRAAQSQKEAAIDLVRLEFDAERLRLGIAQTSGRMRVYEADMAENRRQRAQLIGQLTQKPQS